MIQAETVSAASNRQFNRWALSSLLCIVLVVIGYLFVDRPVATFVHTHFHSTRHHVGWWVYFPEPLAPIGAIILIFEAFLLSAGNKLGPFGDGLLRCSASVLLGTALKEQLKFVFGRTWPESWLFDNPSYFSDGTYGFFPFHGGQGWASFPSGHTTAAFSVAAALWVLWPRFRWVYAMAAALVAAVLIYADFHWVSDVIAGAFLGIAVGSSAATIGKRGTAIGG